MFNSRTNTAKMLYFFNYCFFDAVEGMLTSILFVNTAVKLVSVMNS